MQKETWQIGNGSTGIRGKERCRNEIAEAELEVKDKALSQCNVNLEKANKDLEVVQSEHVSGSQEIVDVKRKLKAWLKNMRNVLVRWNLCRPQKICLKVATIEKLQKELDDKQALLSTLQ